MGNPIIIAVAGKLGVGKDYVIQNMICDRLNPQLSYTRMAFADQIKINVATHKGIPLEQMLSGQKSPEIRKLLQIEGTENGRNIYGDDIWTKTLRSWIDLRAIRDGIDVVLITDCRFPNEVKFIEDMGGIIIRVEASDRNEIALRQESGGDLTLYNSIKNHPSETSLDNHKFRYVLNNQIGNNTENEFSQLALQIMDDDTSDYNIFVD